MDDVFRYVASIEPWDRFLAPEELDEELRRLHDASGGRAPLDVIGASRRGHPLRTLTIGKGDRHALVVGTPHPNEPAGGLAALRLAELLLADNGMLGDLGFTWHVLPCADPDGMRLNSGWFGGPFTYEAYGATIYRPPFPEQFEWTFHRDDLARPGLSPLPESTAVMTLIDDVRPDLFVSMHNAEIGGFFCYVGEPVASIGTAFQTLREMTKVPIECGEPEEPAPRLGAGVFHVPPNLEGDDQLCSTDYAARYGALGVTSETPLWTDVRSEDERPTDRTRAAVAGDIAKGRIAVRDRHGGWVEAIGGDIDLDSVRGRAVLEDAAGLEDEWPVVDLTGDGSATVAYIAGLEHERDLERVRAAGHVAALLREHGNGSPKQRTVLADANDRLAEWASTAEQRTTFVGLDGAVRCHVGIALHCASALAAR